MSKRKATAEDAPVDDPQMCKQARIGNGDLCGEIVNGDDERDEEEIEDRHRSGKRVRARMLKKKEELLPKIDHDVIVDTNNSKRRRTWELWSADDKIIFFEALNEYGKDFDKIQSHFQVKINKKNLPAHYIKNKDQIRAFYYRTWQKLKTYINFTGDLKKSTKEIYGLVNYGELWKKVGSNLDDKCGAKLDELVQKGGVTVKVKGKSIRIKTPICRALKRLNQKHESAKKQPKWKSKLPDKVVLDLRPRDTCDWCKVQKMAQNPHLRVTMRLQRKLSTLIKCLNKKWKPTEFKLKASLKSELGKSVSDDELQEEIVLLPSLGAKINVPVIKPLPTVTSNALSLHSYKKKKEMSRANGEGDSKGLKIKIKLNRGLFDGIGDDASQSNVDTDGLGEADLIGLNGEDVDDHDDIGDECDGPGNDDLEQAEDIITGDFLMEESDQESSRSPLPGEAGSDHEADHDSDPELVDEIRRADDYLEDDDIKDEVGDEMKEEVIDVKDEDLEDVITTHDPSLGWTEDTSGGLTIGELFLMLRGDSKTSVRLDYHWRPVGGSPIKQEPPGEEAGSGECASMLSRLVKLAATAGGRQTRGRQTSVSSNSPNVRFLSPVANGAKSPVSSRPSPGGRAAVAKQLTLPGGGRMERAGSPLAVPLEPQEPEFRMPAAPVSRQGAAMRDAAFREQIGQLLPKFTNRRGRTNRSRIKNQYVVGRQLLQPMTVGPAVVAVQPVAVGPGQLVLPQRQILVPVQLEAADSVTSSIQLANVTSSDDQPRSPPQIHIPSPAPSPAPLRRTPSPTPSLTSFLDTLPETPQPPSTPGKDQFMTMYEGDSSLLQTPPRHSSTPPSSPSRCLADSGDLSLGSWSLGGLNFDTPMKQLSGPIPPSEDSQTSVLSGCSEVGRQVTAMMNEDSLDFTASFRQLVRQVTNSDAEMTENGH